MSFPQILLSQKERWCSSFFMRKAFTIYAAQVFSVSQVCRPERGRGLQVAAFLHSFSHCSVIWASPGLPGRFRLRWFVLMARLSPVALTRTSVSNFHSRKHNGSLSARSEVPLPVSCLRQVIRGSTCEGRATLCLSSLLLWRPLDPCLHRYKEREGEGVWSHT